MLFRLLLATAVVIKAAIVHPDTPNYLSRKLRDLRMSLTDRVGEFLAAYPQRMFSAMELQGVLSYMIQPYLVDAKNNRDEPIVVAPMSIIKMLASVCAYPSHYHLLALRFAWNERRGTLIELLVSPLSWAGLTPHMLNTIRKALLNLLTLADEQLNYTDLDYENIPLEKSRNYGTSLVVAHIQPIIQFLADAVNSSEMKFSQSNLDLLSKLSIYTPDGDLARNMASTILGHLERKLPREATSKKLLDVLGSLMRTVKGSKEFLRRVGPLFSKVEGRTCREPLVRIVEGLQANPEVSDDIKDLLGLVSDLESWDRSRVDEPDQDRRHAAYARLNDVSLDWSISLDDSTSVLLFVDARLDVYLLL
ncbi:hypothetical protein NECAME_03797 [Necator americanus]|uniref:U3 small nucleolar RNA-associated protein 20 N-terminal domain-containing protein n=1 Tax=Necator americanus TaxID=51031 RepID=W2T080_NECAM|nr:hypothetical protein NECAME_03797 [Necator americanus]ETN75415.1 hypothetical protein NECAME_03797 [Necator americanus]